MYCPIAEPSADCNVFKHDGYIQFYIICQMALISELKSLPGIPNVQQQFQLLHIYYHTEFYHRQSYKS